MKKFVKLCAAILVLFVVLTASALAAEVLYSGTCGGEGDGSNLTWTLDDEGTLRVDGNGRMEYYSSYSSKPWYNYRSLIKSAVIGEGVTSIGGFAFSYCSSLTSVTIPSSVTSIGNYAFHYCSSLMSVTIPEGVTSIESSAFYNCDNLTSVTIPESVTSIGNSAFSYCSNLVSVTIPSSVTSIGEYAFCDCSSLTSVTIPEGVTSIGKAVFYGCSSLTSVTIPKSVTSIGYEAFYGCSSLTSVAIPTSVVNIGSFAFDGCTNLKSVYITDLAAWCEIKFNVKPDLIGYFRNNHSANPLYNGADLYINGEKAANIEIPMGVTNIGDSAFYHCSSLTSVTIPEGVTSIGSSAFSGCRSLTSVNIPTEVTSIGDSAFSYCRSLTSVTIPESVTSIGNSAFCGCSSLTSVTVPTSMTSIGTYCFQNSGLKDIYYTGVKSQFVRINIGTNNSTFNQATVHYQGVAVTGVSLNRTSLTLMQGESAQLIATVLPANASDKTVTWSVTNPNVASVAEGVVSALNAGTTDIKVTTADGGFTAVCTVTVTAPPTILNRDTVLVLDDSGSMNGTPLTELKKAAIKFCKNVLEANGNNRIALVIFETDTTVYDFTTDIASLTANINAMRGYGGTNTNYALQKANAFIAQSNADVKSVVLMTDGAPTCKESEVYTAAAAVRSHATLFTLGFFHRIEGSEKTKAQQLLQAIKSEEYYYEVKDGSKLDESFFEISEAITKIPVTGLSLDKEKIVLTEGESLMLNASLEPHDTTERSIYWSSSNTAVATVSENGTVTAVSEGSVTMTAVSANTEIKAECTVIVNSSEAWYYTYTVKDDGTAEITGYRPGLQGDIVIPSYVHEYRVTSIGSRAFYDCRALTSAIIPTDVTSIGDRAFYGCSSLTSVTIPEGVTSIDERAFYGCSSLTSVTIPEGVTSIGSSAFESCESITTVTIPQSVTRIGDHAFRSCRSLISVTIPEGVTRINWRTFCDCSSLTSITIPSSVTSIGDEAFYSCSSLTAITIPSSVTSIGDYAFFYCSSLTSMTIPSSVTSIGERAFGRCSSLTAATIPSSVTSIGAAPFWYCSSLARITVNENNSMYVNDERGVLFDKAKTTLIQYPIGNTATSYEIPLSMTSIGERAFYGCSSLTTVTIPKSVTSIDRYAFNWCDKLEDVYYPGTEEEWKNISIGQYNYYLTRATIHYNATVLTPSVTRTADGAVYKVSAANLPVSSVVVVALYKDGRFVGYESAVYNGETLEIAADTPHDTATILAWSDLEKLIPLAPGTKIGS